MRRLSRRELELSVEQQLGRRPAILFEAEVYCEFGWPAVIRSEPVTPAGNPNPNLYYLTCPFLRHEIATLEDRGWILKLQRLVLAEEGLASRVIDAQRRHAALWTSMAGRPWSTGKDLEDEPRIAAAAADLSFKCLHAHMAWHLAQGDYFPGEMMIGQIGRRSCRDNRCRNLVSESHQGATPEGISGEKK